MYIDERVIIWGTGDFGEKAYRKYGKEKVAFFLDSDEKKIGSTFNGISIISFSDYKLLYNKYSLVLAMSSKYVYKIVEMLKNNKIDKYTIFYDRFVQGDTVISDSEEQQITEKEWNKRTENNILLREEIQKFVEEYSTNVPFVKEIEIETINRCNGVCSFCPVNKYIDTRKTVKMDESLFKKIIDELAELQYNGRIALFSNNEPFLDSRIIDFSKYMRNKLEKAHIHLFTNGTLLTIEKFVEIINYLDELIIDNYNDDYQLLDNVSEIKQYVEEHPTLKNKVGICLRNTTDILSSRGGDAPNRIDIIDYGHCTCALPFQQMVIRPTGEVSLCCNDPLGKETLGDINEQSIYEIWYGERYIRLREDISRGRNNVEHCKKCDTFMLF